MRLLLSFMILFSLSAVQSARLDMPLDRESVYSPDIVLHLMPPMVTGPNVKLPYKIPFPGYIEFYLFDAEKKKIWQDFGVKEKGEHAQSLKAEKFTKGAVYHYEFWYKGKAYPGKFSI